MIGSEHQRPLPPATIAFLAILALTALRIVVLFTTPLSLGGDEAQYWFWSRDLAWGYFSKPPMIAWVIAATTALFGDGEGVVRLGAPLLHAGTAAILYLLGRDMAGARAGMWAAILYLTLPAVSFSSGIISTDTPLLFFWSAALLALWRGLRTSGVGWALALGTAVGFGLLTKYAMAYFVLCAIVYGILTPSARPFLFGLRGAAALVLALAILAPNLWWNFASGWATIGHTASNAHLAGRLFHPDKAGEFILSQLAVFGPIPLVAWLWRIVALRRDGAEPPERMLVWFSVPILLLILVQAFLSRANANWAATAYVAAAVLVALWLLRYGRVMWLKAAVGMHLVFAAILYAAVLMPDSVFALTGRDPFANLRDWRPMAAEVRAVVDETGLDVVTSDHRTTLAALIYQLRDEPIRLRAWDHDGIPDNHYEFAVPYVGAVGDRIIHVSRAADPKGVRRFFRHWREVARFDRRRPSGRIETFHVYEMSGYVGEDARWATK